MNWHNLKGIINQAPLPHLAAKFYRGLYMLIRGWCPDAKGEERDLRGETWILGFDQRPPFGGIVSHRQRPHTHRPPICNLFTDSEQRQRSRGIRGKSRKGESKWGRWSSEVFLRVIPHRRRTLQNKQTPPITSDFATKKCPSCFEPS